MAFAAGRLWSALRGGGRQRVPLEGFLDALGGGGADALVDSQCLLQVLRGVAGVAVVEVAVADAFQGAGFLSGRAESRAMASVWVCWSRAWLVVWVRVASSPSLFSASGLAEPVAEVAEQFEGPLVPGGGGLVVPGQLLHHAQVVADPGLVGPVAQVAEDLQGLSASGLGGCIVAGAPLQYAEVAQGFGFAETVTQAAVQVQRIAQVRGRGRVVAVRDCAGQVGQHPARSWTSSRFESSAFDSPAVRPVLSASARTSATPACDTSRYHPR
jgi:hypothetical protein